MYDYSHASVTVWYWCNRMHRCVCLPCALVSLFVLDMLTKKRCALQHYSLYVFESRHAYLHVHAFIPLFSCSHVCTQRPSFFKSPCDVNMARWKVIIWISGERVWIKGTQCIWTAQNLECGIIKHYGTRHQRVITTLMCGLITTNNVRQSHSNYALIIFRELRSRRTLWKSVYPAAE